MAFKESFAITLDLIKRAEFMDRESALEIVGLLEALNKTLTTIVESKKEPIIVKGSIKPYGCLKCKETDPTQFNRKKTECTPCMSKAGYEKIKVKLDEGKERNILARLERGNCSVCNLVVTRDTAQMFDWDHKSPAEKSCAISRMNYKSDEIFRAEIAKCDLTCRNCHMMRTMVQFKDNSIKKRTCKKSEITAEK